MKDIEAVKDYIRKALIPVNNNVKFGAPLVKDPNYARFWEGRMVEVDLHKKDLDTIYEMLTEE